MRKLFLFSVFTCLVLTALFAQENTSITDQSKEFQEQFYGNVDYMQGAKLYWQGDEKAARPFFIKAVETFEIEKNWEAFIDAGDKLADTYTGKENYQEGLEIAQNHLRKIKEESPEHLSECFYYYQVIFRIYREANQVEEATAFLVEKIEECKAQRDWELFVHLSAELIQSYSTSPDYKKGIAIGNATIATLENNIAEDSKLFFYIYDALSTVYHWNHEGKKALEFAYKINKLLQKTPENYSNHIRINNYITLGLSSRDIGNMEDALRYLLQAEDIAEQLDSEKIILLSDVQRHLCHLFCTIDAFEKSIEYGMKALTNAQGFLDMDTYNSTINDCYNVLAWVFSAIGEHEQGIAYLEKAIEVIESDKNSYLFYYQLPNLYTSIGESYISLKNWEKAAHYFQKSLDITYTDEVSQPEAIGTWIAMARLYLDKDNQDVEKAQIYLEEAEKGWEKATEESDKDGYYDYILLNLYGVYAQLWEVKGDIPKAKGYIHAAIALERGFSASSFSHFYFQLANWCEAEAQLDSALLYNNQAIYRISNLENAEFERLPAAKDFYPTNLTYDILQQRARLVTKMYETASDNEYTKLEEALSLINLADQVHLYNLKQMNILRAGQSKALIESSIPSYQTGLELAYKYNNLKPSKALLERSFYYSQKMKAQQLWLTQLESKATRYGNIPTELLEQERELVSNITFYENRLVHAEKKQDTEVAEYIEKNQLFELKRVYNELLRKIALEYPEYHEAKYAFVPETGERLQKILHEDELLVEYVLADSTLFIFTLAQDQALEVQQVELEASTLENIESFHQKLQNASWMRRSSREKFITLSHQLYQQFLVPIETKLHNKKRLIIIGDGMTNYIPFETLLPSDELQPFKNLNYLIRTHEVSYHYSANLFAKARKQKRVTTSGIYAFAPVYDDTGEAVGAVSVSKPVFNDNLRAFDKDGNFTPLPESEREVKAIIKLFSNTKNSNNTLSLRTDAVESELKEQLQHLYQYIHIAGHSFADLENPKTSGIACFKEQIFEIDSTQRLEDGILHVGEIYNINIKADLVTLSSCESGYGKLDASEGILGINRAFIYAGTPNVVFSLWKVYDKISASLMLDFYKEVLEGEDYAASLRAAKLKILNEEATAAPHFWSPFLLIGR